MKRPESTEQVGRQALASIEERLPTGWTLRNTGRDSASSGVDFSAEVTSPSGQRATLWVEAKRVVERRDIPSLQKRIDSWASGGADFTGMVAASYLSPQVRGELAELGISYVDATGNVEVSLSEPGLYIRDVGAQSDPWRGAGRPRGTLKGDPAARVVRALIDYDRPWKVTDLIDVARASVGATYRVVDYLQSEGLITDRTESATFTVPSWRKLLVAWSADYNTYELNRVTRWFEPRGLSAVLDRVNNESVDLKYAVTASLAASEWAPYAPTRAVFVYAADTELAAKRWELRQTETSPNVLLIEPKSDQDVVFANSWTRLDGLTLASPAQVAVDLINGPGRNPSEAEELLDWMERNESQWRK